MKKFVVTALTFAPAVALAQPTLNNLATLLFSIGRLIDLALPIVVALALLAFFWGLVRYIFAGTDDAKVAGRTLMLWGIIALFVMISVWGLVRFVGDALGIQEQGGEAPVPGVQGI